MRDANRLAAPRNRTNAEDHHEWNSPFDVTDIGVYITFDVNYHGQLVGVTIERRGSGL